MKMPSSISPTVRILESLARRHGYAAARVVAIRRSEPQI
jgi:hypothetical protein